MEVFWNSYVIVYDSGAQRQLFRSAQDRLQAAQATMAQKSGKWITDGQRFSDVFSDWIRKLMGGASFWILVAIAGVAGVAFKYRRPLKTQLQIWSLRSGQGSADEELVEELFYRATRLAEGASSTRSPTQTWREWIFGLPDPQRRSILARALVVFEKSKYGRLPVSAADFALLEEAVRHLKVRPAYSPLRDGGNILE